MKKRFGLNRVTPLKFKEFISKFEKEKIKYVIVAGFGLDGKRGYQTRVHQDIDVLCLKKDFVVIKKVMKKMGYIGKRIKDTCKFVREDRTKVDMGLLSIEKEKVVTYGRSAVTRFPKKLFDNPKKGRIGKIKFKIGSNELLRLWGVFSKIKKDREYSKKIPVNETIMREISRELRKKEIKSENFYKYLDKKVLNKK